VIECQGISLDPMDRLQTDSGLTSSWTSWHEALTLDKSVSSAFTTSDDLFKDGYDIPRIRERRMSDSATQTGKSLQAADHGSEIAKVILNDSLPAWRPTDVCGMATPPSEHMSPATSTQDLAIPQNSLSVSQHFNTPVMMATPGESPTSSLAGDLAQSSPMPSKKQQMKQRPLPVTRSLDSSSTCKTVYVGSNLNKIITSPHICDTQTSTPKSEKNDRQSIEGMSEKIAEDFKSEVSLSSEPVTPIDKLSNYDYSDINKVKTETSPDETGEELTCGDHTTTTSESVVKEIKRILSETSFGALEGEGTVPDNPPPSLEVSLVSDTNNIKHEYFDGGASEHSTNLLENECVENHLEKSLTDTTGSNEGICFVAKASENKTQKELKPTATQDTQTTPNTTTVHQHLQQNKPMKRNLSQNGNCQEGDEESSDNCFKKFVINKPTPVEILDSYIQVGSNVHTNELGR